MEFPIAAPRPYLEGSGSCFWHTSWSKKNGICGWSLPCILEVDSVGASKLRWPLGGFWKARVQREKTHGRQADSKHRFRSTNRGRRVKPFSWVKPKGQIYSSANFLCHTCYYTFYFGSTPLFAHSIICHNWLIAYTALPNMLKKKNCPLLLFESHPSLLNEICSH